MIANSILFSVIWLFILIFVFHLDKKSHYLILFFNICMFVFIVLGILIFPFFTEAIIKMFIKFDIHLINEFVHKKALEVVTYGTIITNFTYYFLKYFLNSKGFNCLNNNHIRTGIKFKIFALSFFAILIASLYFFKSVPLLFIGDMFTARRAATDNYFIIVCVYNVLPFSGVLLYGYSLMRRVRIITIFTFFFNCIICMTLILTFQKSKLLIYVFELFFIRYIIKILMKNNYSKKIDFKIINKKVFLGITIGFVILMLLFNFYTNYKDNLSSGKLILKLSEVSLSRILGRLSASAMIYMYYFPENHDFYGFSNVRFFSKIFGNELYKDAKELFAYFYKGNKDGSLAASSYIDFYCQFGWISLMFGSMLLGILIYIFSGILRKIKNPLSYTVFWTFSFVFLYYLSQASIFRSLLSYGGGIFFVLWFLIFRLKIKLKS